MVPFKSLGTVSYLPSTVTITVSLAISKIFSVKERPDLEIWVRGLQGPVFYPDPQPLGGELRMLGGSTTERRRREVRVAVGDKTKTETPKASRGCGMGRGYPLPSRLGDLGERRELPQRGPGQSFGRKRIWCTLELSGNHWWQSF